MNSRKIALLSFVFIIILSSCKPKNELSPQYTLKRVNFKMDDLGCGNTWGFVNKEDSVFIYHITNDYIKFKFVDDTTNNEILCEYPSQYENTFASLIADVLPISNEEIVISSIDNESNVCITLYNCVRNEIDTICQTGMKDGVYFSGAKNGDMEGVYHKESNSVFFTAVDHTVNETERKSMDVRCVYQVNLSTGEHAFIDLKYPENYLDRIRISLTSDCYINPYKEKILVVFPMDEIVYKYDPSDESVEEFLFEEFEHNPILSSDSTVRNMDDVMGLYLQTFQYYRVFYDDLKQRFYRFYGDTATTENPQRKTVGVALYDNKRRFINRFSVNDSNIKNSYYNAIMTKNGLLFFEEINKEKDYIILAYLRAG
jgi:hypothetical protein